MTHSDNRPDNQDDSSGGDRDDEGFGHGDTAGGVPFGKRAEAPQLAGDDDDDSGWDDRGDDALPLKDDEDTALPWLEGDDGDDEYDGYSTGHILGLVLLGLVVMGLVVGGIWFATRHSGSNPDLVADGSTVKAPAEPYKQPPEDPGGKTFEGTGDTSFAVSQGQNRPARLGQDGAAASPGFESVDSAPPASAPASPPASPAASRAATPSPAPSASSATAAAATSGVGVQVGAYSTREAAEAGWTRLASQNSALSGVRHRIVEGQADIGKVYRLQAVTANADGARALCGQLKGAGINCQVKN